MHKKYKRRKGCPRVSLCPRTISKKSKRYRRDSKNTGASPECNPHKPKHTPMLLSASAEVVLKSLKRIPDKRQRHLWRLLLLGSRGGLQPAVHLHSVGSLQLQVLGGEVGGVDVRRQARLEGGTEAAEVVEIDAGEEWVAPQLVGSTTAEAVLAIADETERILGVNDRAVDCGGGGGEGVKEVVCLCRVWLEGMHTFELGAQRSARLGRRQGSRGSAAN